MRTLVVLLTLLVVAGSAEQPFIAIVNLEAMRCEQDLADACSEVLRTEIINTGIFRVTERAQLDRLLEEEAFQLSALVDDSTVAELGKLVGADFVALGSLSVIGSTYTISIRFIDVETAEAALGKTETTNSESGLPDVCRRLAAALTGLPSGGTSGGGYSSEPADDAAARAELVNLNNFYYRGMATVDGVPVALVEDADGFGLCLMVGDHIAGGKVVEISPNELVVSVPGYGRRTLKVTQLPIPIY